MQHPASKKQLEDVWEKQDGLKDEDFNPKTFFYLHGEYDCFSLWSLPYTIVVLSADKNSDGALDVYEIEALFMSEVHQTAIV